MHIKRKTIGSFWPVAKTGEKYLAVPSHEQRNAIPLILAMRDVLKLVKTKKELKKILNEKQIMINGRTVKEVNYPLMLYDSLTLPSIKKYYKVTMKGRRFDMIEVSEEKASTKTYRVMNKRLLENKKLQVNFSQGKNMITNEKLQTGEFVVIDNKTNKILKVVALKKDVEVLVVAGKHTGKSGKIKDMVEQGKEKVAVIKTQNGEINANIKNIFVKE